MQTGFNSGILLKDEKEPADWRFRYRCKPRIFSCISSSIKYHHDGIQDICRVVDPILLSLYRQDRTLGACTYKLISRQVPWSPSSCHQGPASFIAICARSRAISRLDLDPQWRGPLAA